MKKVQQIKKWTKQLRSGKYSQTTGALQDTNGFCCLGVACSVLKTKNLKLDDENFIAGGFPEDQKTRVPKWLHNINGHFEKKTGLQLSNLNDADGWYDGKPNHSKYTFDEIADLIELVYVHKALG